MPHRNLDPHRPKSGGADAAPDDIPLPVDDPATDDPALEFSNPDQPFDADIPLSQTTSSGDLSRKEAELELLRLQTEIGELQLTQLQRQSDLQLGFEDDLQRLLTLEEESATAARARADKLEPIEDELLQIALEDIRAGPGASPEEQALIDEQFQGALDAGLIDIERFETEGLEAIRQASTGRGLRPGDSPVLGSFGRLGAEALRQRGSLGSSLRAGQAQAGLNFPLASGQIQSAAILGTASLTEATRQFQQQLANQAFNNRLNLQNSIGGLGLSLSQTAPGFPNFRAGGSAGGGGGGTLGTIGQIASIAGSVIGAFSSKDFKTDKQPLDEEAILEAFESLPVEFWRYKSAFGLGEEEHIGPYAEDFKSAFGLGDGKTISFIDAHGVTMAALKGLAKKLRDLQAGFGLKEAKDAG